jgi:hypothetical protein
MDQATSPPQRTPQQLAEHVRGMFMATALQMARHDDCRGCPNNSVLSMPVRDCMVAAATCVTAG